MVECSWPGCERQRDLKRQRAGVTLAEMHLKGTEVGSPSLVQPDKAYSMLITFQTGASLSGKACEAYM